ncbi:efflux RND transporter permease subunit, partial [Pseudomonas sp. 5C2]|nr:efflux RND transporter permease subunit [Pseudomonas sp. 5C2]
SMTGDYGVAWSCEAFEDKKSGGTYSKVFAFGLIMVFLILASQYEKWSLPVGVLLQVQNAFFGALLSVLMRGLANDVYFQIGL